MLKSISQDSQRQGFDMRNCVISRLAVDHDPWQVRNFRDPAAVFFLL